MNLFKLELIWMFNEILNDLNEIPIVFNYIGYLNVENNFT